MLCYHPAVYLYEGEYHILVKTTLPTILWVKVGDRCFYDHSGGILRSDVRVHRCLIPQRLLDEAKEYTVCYRRVFDRTAYFPKIAEEQQETYVFRPAMGSKAKFFHIADVHSKTDPAKAAAGFIDRIDGLILNGDVPDDCGVELGGKALLDFIGEVGKGEIPTIFVRGNHDTRGAFAEHLEDYIPHKEGRTYFTAQLGDLWILALDCGEDKPDDHVAYNGINCFHHYRLEETEWLKKVVAEGAYKDPSIKHRWVICHHPFSSVLEPPFDIELDIYKEWCSLIKEIGPEVMICGHMHQSGHFLPGGRHDMLGQPCPICIGGRPKYHGLNTYEAATFERDGEDLIFKVVNDLGEEKLTAIVGRSEEMATAK